jgi:undecaprenyl-diphosphatase
MSYRSALAIGAVQAVAPLPGISRSGSTLSMALMLGLDVKFAVTFSFLMGIPAILAALLLDAKEFFNGTFSFEPAIIITGLATSALFGLLAIRMVRWLAQERRLRYFGYYTLTLGSLVVIVGLFELATGHAVQAAAAAFLAS